MLSFFYPKEYVPSVFAIDYEKLYEKGYRALIIDIDNTLVPHGADSTPEIDALFASIHAAGLRTMILSNNSEERVQRFLRNIDSDYVYDAHKPQPSGYRAAVRKLGLKKKEVVVIGDQVFTDVLGANLTGLDSILVAFIRKPGETRIGKRRTVEQFILRCYARSARHQHRLGDIRSEAAV